MSGGVQGGMRLVIRERPEIWNDESTRFHGPNMVSFGIVSNSERTPLISAYLSPSTFDHLLDQD